MISERMVNAINKQINMELYSGYIYLSIAQYFESEGLPGMASWNKAQTMEEFIHVRRFMDFINERGGRVKLDAIAAPQFDWDSPLDAFETIYSHECRVTGLINKLMDVALEEHDHAASIFLQWFVSEQVEEEATTKAVVDRLRLIEKSGGAGGGLFMLDNELANRPMPTDLWTDTPA